MLVWRELQVSPEEEWIVLVPVKALVLAKSRLAVGADRRRQLALDFATHTVSVASRVPHVKRTVVITDDDEVVRRLMAPGVSFLSEPAGRPGLNACLERSARAVRERRRAPLAILVADLPRLADAELARALDCAASYDRAVVADADGAGTTLLTAGRGLMPQPCFGQDSFRRHVSRGYTPLAGNWPGLRRDVDILDHLCAVEEWIP